ncbi:MAG: hypothetical protein JXQ76_07755 [Campylobacterales bacterium]|nr:hypothetical protein [Campylobacterales bacterium]
MQMKGKVNINDDEELEKEADIMGEKALQMKTADSANNTKTSSTSQTVQRTAITANEFKKFVVTGLIANKENKNAIAAIEKENQLLNDFKATKISNIEGMKSVNDKSVPLKKQIALAQILVDKAKNKEIKKTKKTPFYNAMIEDLQGDRTATDKTLGIYHNLVNFNEMKTLNKIASPTSDEQSKLDNLKEEFSQTKETELKEKIKELTKKERLTPQEETELVSAKDKLALIEHHKKEEEIKGIEGQQRPLTAKDQEKLDTLKEGYAQNEEKLNTKLQENLGVTFDGLKTKVSYNFERVGIKAALKKTAGFKLMMASLKMIGGFIGLLLILAFKPLGLIIKGIAKLIKGLILFTQEAKGIGEDGFSNELKTGITLLSGIASDNLADPIKTIKRVGYSFKYLADLFKTRKDANARAELISKFEELASKMSKVESVIPSSTPDPQSTTSAPTTQPPQQESTSKGKVDINNMEKIVSYTGIPKHIKKAMEEAEAKEFDGDENSKALHKLIQQVEGHLLEELSDGRVFDEAKNEFDKLDKKDAQDAEYVKYYKDKADDYRPSSKISIIYHSTNKAYKEIVSKSGMHKLSGIKVPQKGFTTNNAKVEQLGANVFEKLEKGGLDKEASRKLMEKMIDKFTDKKETEMPYLSDMIQEFMNRMYTKGSSKSSGV